VAVLSKSKQEESAVMSFFTSSVVCAALSVTLSLQELGGTVGGRIAITWKPDFNRYLQQ
jgi:hypothetical protein